MIKRFIKLILIISSTIGISNFGIADEITQIDTEHKDLVIGTISISDFKEEIKQFIESHPEYKLEAQNLTRSDEKSVPPYIRLLKLAPNPHYKKPPQSMNETLQLSMANFPQSRQLKLAWPALDQGAFGTCVTFATLGIIVNASGQPIPSPSCTLQLLNSLGQNAWNGYWIYKLIPYIQNYGWIAEGSPNIQWTSQSGFCNPTYPTYQPNGNNSQTQATLSISTDTYKTHSYLLHPYKEQYVSDANSALGFIKQQLNDSSSNNVDGNPGYLSEFAFYVSNEPNVWVNLNDGRYPVWVDTNYVNTNAGHAIYVYGYDDNITVDGQKGVLYLRNSWGSNNGNNGNYLMTYAYFYRNFRTDEPILSFQNTKPVPPHIHI